MTDKSETPKGKRPARKTVELASLREWLASLNHPANPAVHVNGSHFPTAVLSVDFGSPIKSQKLTSDQVTELGLRLRRVAKELVGRDANYRVSVDQQNGIHWVSASIIS
jgi:hypothetical protein